VRLALFRAARFQLGIVLIGLIVIASTSALLTYMGAKHHDQHYIGMALLDRQRDLVQQLSWLALVDPRNPEFAADAQAFQENMRILRSGGAVVNPAEAPETVPATHEPLVLTELDATLVAWRPFRVDAQALWSLPLAANRSEAIRALRADMPALSRELTKLHSMYEQHMEADVDDLKRLQALALLGAAPLLIWGYLIIRRRIVRPAAVLAAAAQPFRPHGPAPSLQAEAYNDELGQVLRSFEVTRAEIDAANRLVESQISERTRLLMSAFEFSQEIVGQLELNHLLKLAAEKSMSLMGAHSAAICLFESNNTYLKLASAQGKVAASIGLYPTPQSGQPIQIIDQIDDAGDGGSCAGCAFGRACQSAIRVSTLLQVGNKAIGSLCVVRDADKLFDINDRRALSLLCGVAAVAISNARLLQANRYSAEQSAVLAERKRLAAEIHDNLAQTLSYLGLKLERVREMIGSSVGDSALIELQSVQSVTLDAYRQVRTVLNGLSEPEARATTHLIEAVTAFVTDFCRTTGLVVELDLDEAAVSAISPLAQTQTLHIIREALTNVHRHAHASRAAVRVWRAQSGFCARIEDNGRGFDRNLVNDQISYGLAIMQARAERSGGKLTLHSAAGNGTVVQVFFAVSEAGSLSLAAGRALSNQASYLAGIGVNQR